MMIRSSLAPSPQKPSTTSARPASVDCPRDEVRQSRQVEAWLTESRRILQEMRQEERSRLGDELVANWVLIPHWPKDALADSPLDIAIDDALGFGIATYPDGICVLDSQQRSQHLAELMQSRGEAFFKQQALKLAATIKHLPEEFECLHAWAGIAQEVDRPEQAFRVLHSIARQPGNPRGWLETASLLCPALPGLRDQIALARDEYAARCEEIRPTQKPEVPINLLME